MARKQRIFIASSGESLAIAEALQRALEHSHEVTIWSQGVFTPARGIFGSIVEAVAAHRYGIFVFGPDDILESRERKIFAPRLNVVLEAGYFAGVHGMHRTFIVQPRGGKVETLSDLAGINPVDFDLERFQREPDAAMGSAASSIKVAIQRDRLIYPAARLAMKNILSPSVAEMHSTQIPEQPYCFCVELGAGQSIRVEMSLGGDAAQARARPGDVIGFRLAAANALWDLKPTNPDTPMRRTLIAEGPGIATHSFGIGALVDSVGLDVYENDDEAPTWSKCMSVRHP